MARLAKILKNDPRRDGTMLPAPSRWLLAFGLFPLILFLLVAIGLAKIGASSTLVVVPQYDAWMLCANDGCNPQAFHAMSHDTQRGPSSRFDPAQTEGRRAARVIQWAFPYISIGYAHSIAAHAAHCMYVVRSYALAHSPDNAGGRTAMMALKYLAGLVIGDTKTTTGKTFWRNERESHSVILSMAGVHIPVERKAETRITNTTPRKNRLGGLNENVWGGFPHPQPSENKTHGVGLAGTRGPNIPANLVSLSLANTIIPLNNKGDIPRRNNEGGTSLWLMARQSDRHDRLSAESGRPSAALRTLYASGTGDGITSCRAGLSGGY